METFERNIDNITEEEDYGCIVGCALTDTLQEIMAGLSGGYAILFFNEKNSTNPDTKKLSRWEKRSEELVALKLYFARSGKSYNDIRRWIKVYADELKHVNILRDQYAD